MIETTVTMSLERFKELESYEKAFELLKRDSGKFLWARGFGYEYLVELSNEPNATLARDLDTAVKMRDDIINEVRQWEMHNHKKVFN